MLRFARQRGRFIAALVRPLVWLLVFAAGFRTVLGVSIVPPYETYVTYEVYIAPGLVAMIQLFNGMQSSLSMVYDREMGSMRILLVSPLPRWYLLLCKLLAGTLVSILQVYAFLMIAWLFGIESRVEEGRGGGRLPVAMAGAFAAAPQSGWPWPRFPSPLIEPDVRISRIRLSDWLHRKAHGRRPLQAGVSRRHRGT